MKYIKRNINNKKNFKNYIFFLLILFFFILGGLNERYSWKEKIKFYIFDAYENFFVKINYNSLFISKIYFDIKLEDYKYLTSVRNKKILEKNISQDKWVNTKISTLNTKKFNAKIKLKGQLEDHFEHEKKWSFKIKIDDNFNVNGLTDFTLQRPKTLNYLNEWLFQKALKKQGLIALNTDYVELVINGENLGIYIIQESLSKNTLEKNKRRDSSMVGFDNDIWLKEVTDILSNSINSIEQSYFRSKIKPVGLSKSEENLDNINLKKSIFLLDSFRKKSLKTSEVFDTEQLTDALILKAIFAASEFDWADMNFYYNPFTNLLEPILKEVHTIEKFETHQDNWWLDSYSESANLFSSFNKTHTNYFLDQIYSDKEFYEIYLNKLNKFLINEDYIKKLIIENSQQYNLYKKILQINFPFAKVIGTQSQNVFEMQKKKILDALNPKVGINAFLLESNNNNLIININNLQRVPLKVLGLINEKDNAKILLEQNYFIDGYKSYDTPPKDNKVTIDCSQNSMFCDLKNLKNIKVIYKLLSQDEINYESIERLGNDKKFLFNQNKKNIDLKKFDFIEYSENNKIYKFKKGIWNIREDIIFDKGNIIQVPPNTELVFSNNARIISYSPISLIGTKNEPIKLRGDINQKKNKEFTGGITVINAKEKSYMKNVITNDLSGSIINKEVLFSGAITFYNSDIEISDSVFNNNLGTDDYINVVNSKFDFNNLLIKNSLFDAIDIDFGYGVMNNIKIENSGNDALDFSGSNVKLNNLTLINSGDKSISVGENSFVSANSVLIENSNIGVASKDNSFFKGEDIHINNSKIGLAAYIKKYYYSYPVIEINKFYSKKNNIEYLSQEDGLVIINNENFKKIKFNYSSL